MPATKNIRVTDLTACLFFVVLLSHYPAHASSEQTKTVEFDVKPGGTLYEFTESIGGYECSFSFVAQGGTNENWLMSVGLSDDKTHFSCSVWRPTGKSYLFFTAFKMELKGTKVEYANAFSQLAGAGQTDKDLKSDEYTIQESTVTHTEGKFNAQLCKLMVVGRTRHQEL
ncbi:myeloid-derived growth factor [Corythoichthys intestinalis]|uniref:myeloid-derived growth factor n=1 Tax=Corythoichthys intestinalis TaxID=161448 RepID=UPI0025A6897C|nr:myeloid-derived growth factor [Corythoichthys intestinalis]XP_057697139.1 myeloid-derived growth factor [Corythoichthys intestinalis]XP_061791031.1 myeloid-derived growth factor-like [Nerophis lumbriciformis]